MINIERYGLRTQAVQKINIEFWDETEAQDFVWAANNKNEDNNWVYYVRTINRED